jgi:hypothetical protein
MQPLMGVDAYQSATVKRTGGIAMRARHECANSSHYSKLTLLDDEFPVSYHLVNEVFFLKVSYGSVTTLLLFQRVNFSLYLLAVSFKSINSLLVVTLFDFSVTILVQGIEFLIDSLQSCMCEALGQADL